MLAGWTKQGMSRSEKEAGMLNASDNMRVQIMTVVSCGEKWDETSLIGIVFGLEVSGRRPRGKPNTK